MQPFPEVWRIFADFGYFLTWVWRQFCISIWQPWLSVVQAWPHLLPIFRRTDLILNGFRQICLTVYRCEGRIVKTKHVYVQRWVQWNCY